MFPFGSLLYSCTCIVLVLLYSCAPREVGDMGERVALLSGSGGFLNFLGAEISDLRKVSSF